MEQVAKDQLEWQDLETQRQNFRLCMLFKIIHHQTCIPLSDITSPTTTTSSTIMTRSDVNNIRTSPIYKNRYL